jgi:peptide/nickel transport system permease protein
VTNNTTEDRASELVIEEPEKKDPIGVFTWLCVAWLALNVIVAVFAPLLPLQDPNSLANEPGLGMSFQHLMGTDDLGRDIFGRLAWGSRISLGVGIGAMAIGFGIGGPLGMLAAYRRGRLDTIFSSLMFTLLAFPSIIAIIAILSFWTPRSLSKIILVIGISSIPLVYRVMRAATLGVGSREFVTAARMQGAKDRRIIFRELLPNVAPTGLSFLLFGIATVIALEGVLAFLGLSIPPDEAPSWGNMINDARQSLNDIPQNWPLIIFPSVLLCFFILALNFAGDKFRSYFDVTEVKL